jgi:basic amino acid/polyamine antiporter, APA family
LVALPETLPAARRQGRLLRVLGVAFGLAIIIGNSIGVGILRTPGDIAARLPSEPLFLGVWIAGGIYALLGALSLAELGAMIPRSGGQYVFVRRALGEYPGFVVGWSDWISTCGSTAAVSIVLGEYSGVLFPALAGRETATAVAAVLAFAGIQWRGIKWGDSVQQITSLAKTLGFGALILACFLLVGAHGPSVPVPTPAGAALFAAVTVSLQGVIYTYDGWNGIFYFSEEVRDPGRDIVRSTIVGVLMVITIYLLVNLAFLHVLSIGGMAGEPFVAGAAAKAIFGAKGDTVIRALMVVSILSTINALQLMASRVPLAMSRDGLLPARVASVSEGGAPRVALLAGTAVAVLLLLTGTFNQVLALLAFYFVLNYLLSFTSIFVLRLREPDTERPYRVWGFPWTTGIALLGSAGFLIANVAGDTRNSVRSLVILALSFPVFLAVQRAIKAKAAR